MRTVLRATFAVSVLAIIAFGFYLTGSPSENRLFREDELRVQSLGNLRHEITRYFRTEEKAPESLSSLFMRCESRTDYSCRRLQSINLDDFELGSIDPNSFELCTTFARAARLRGGVTRTKLNPRHHDAGRHCYPYQFPKL